MNRLLRKHPLACFYVLTCLLSWAAWLPGVLADHEVEALRMAGTFAPALTALVLTALLQGKAGLRSLWRRLILWRVGVGWYALSLLGTAAVVLSAIGMHLALGGSSLTWNDPAEWYLALVALVYVLFTSVLGEEIGWRGFALPRLLSRYSPLRASLLLGLGWGLWHWPLWHMAGNFHQTIPFWLFLAQSVALSVLYTWMANRTRGSLLLAHLFHAASNTTLGIFPVLPMDTAGSLRPLYFAVALLIVFAAAVAAAERMWKARPLDWVKT